MTEQNMPKEIQLARAPTKSDDCSNSNETIEYSNSLPGKTEDTIITRKRSRSRTEDLENLEDEDGPIFSDSVHRYRKIKDFVVFFEI